VTQFLAYGQQRGAKTMNGECMFLGQAVAGWTIWNE
jgi:shikimate dehydrogenase